MLIQKISEHIVLPIFEKNLIFLTVDVKIYLYKKSDKIFSQNNCKVASSVTISCVNRSKPNLRL